MADSKIYSIAIIQQLNMVLSCAGVQSNLLVQFRDDNIDETQDLVATLEAASIAMSSSTSSKSKLTVRQLPGDHVRPLRQAFGDLPNDLAEVANQAVTQGSFFLQGLSNMATQAGFREVCCLFDYLTMAANPLSGFIAQYARLVFFENLQHICQSACEL